MMNKITKQILPMFLLLFGALGSCTSGDEPEVPATASGINLVLQTTAGNTRSSVGTGTEAENKIDNVRLWFFADGAGGTDMALFCTPPTAVTPVNGELRLNYTDEVLRLYAMTSEGSYSVFVVANLPADATINNETTLDELKAYKYTAPARPGSPFCMTGNSNGSHCFGTNSLVIIDLVRVASRLDIKVLNETGKTLKIDKISIASDQKSVQLFAPAAGTTPASDAFVTPLALTVTPTTDGATCSGYIYENLSTDAVKILIEGSIDGTANKWTAELKPDGTTTLPRNSICGVTLNLKGTSVLVTVGVEPWDKTSFDSEVRPQ